MAVNEIVLSVFILNCGCALEFDHRAHDVGVRVRQGALHLFLGALLQLERSCQVDVFRTGGLIGKHGYPFTQVHPDDLSKLESAPLEVRSRAYDLVMNGREIASGSIRITDPAVQSRVFAALGIGEEEARRKFGFLLEAFEYGAPPHGGIAPGIDRLVMEGLGEENIRDVVAYPKNQQAQELMTGAPAPAEPAQLSELGLVVKPARA